MMGYELEETHSSLLKALGYSCGFFRSFQTHSLASDSD